MFGNMFGQRQQDDGVPRGPSINMDLDVTYGGLYCVISAWTPACPLAPDCAVPAHCTLHDVCRDIVPMFVPPY